MKVSFVVLTHRATRALLRPCLTSLAGDAASGDVEVLVGLNGLGEEGAAERAALEREFPWARVFELPALPRGEARNLLVEKAGGEIVHFLDDDAWAPPGFVARLVALYERHPDAPAAGGPNVGPPGAPAFERAVDFLLRSPLGAGPMRARYLRAGAEGPRPGWSFMLTNLGARRAAFLDAAGFPGTASAEENLFLHRVEKARGRAVFSPELFVFHKRRGSTRTFLAQVYCNGKGRGEITAAKPSSLQLAALAPAALLAAALFAPAVLGVYACACVLEAARLALVERDPAAAWRLPFLIPAAHLAYACGLGAGLLSEGRSAIRAPARLRDVAAPRD